MTEEASCSDNDAWVVVEKNAQVVVESKLEAVENILVVVGETCTCGDDVLVVDNV